jgi:hypothetical protein
VGVSCGWTHRRRFAQSGEHHSRRTRVHVDRRQPPVRAGIDQIVRQPEHRRRLDYVFVGSWHAHPNAHSHIQQAALAFDALVDGVRVSDHYGVVIDLDIGADG